MKSDSLIQGHEDQEDDEVVKALEEQLPTSLYDQVLFGKTSSWELF